MPTVAHNPPGEFSLGGDCCECASPGGKSVVIFVKFLKALKFSDLRRSDSRMARIDLWIVSSIVIGFGKQPFDEWFEKLPWRKYEGEVGFSLPTTTK